MQIENKVFLVSGGASGLGAATAEMLVAAGAKVMLVDLNADAVAAQAQKLGAQARSAVADISQEAAAEAAVQATVAAFGGLHGLVNCAGVVRGEKILGKNGPHVLANFAQVINVNLIGSFNLLRLAGRNHPAQPGQSQSQGAAGQLLEGNRPVAECAGAAGTA